MRTRNITDLLFGAKVTSRKPPRPEMTLIVRGTFLLQHGGVARLLEGIPLIAQGPLRAETFRNDDDERAGECLYPGDFADFKPRADLLLRGHCHAPGNRLTRECEARFSVGKWSKALRIVGRRVWTEKLLGPAMSEPQPFVKMPLAWTESYGGPGHARNPVGKGFGSGELPTIEDPRAPIQNRHDRPEPAGFGPINPAWPQRSGKMGKEYGAAYRKTRAPYYAEDFDWSYFNAAPLDQQLSSYLRGDEEISFHNLHPDHPVYSSRLPGLRVRAFVKDKQAHFREAVMVLDTLFVDMDKEHLVLTWRGLTEVREADLSDVTFSLIAAEPLAEPRLPEDYYRILLDEFEADPLGLKDLPPSLAESLARSREAESAQKKAASESSQDGDPLDALLDQKLAPLLPEDRARVRARIDEAIANAPPGTDMRAKILEIFSGGAEAEAPPPAIFGAPGAKPRVSLRPAVQSIFDAAAKARARAEENKATPEDLKIIAQAEQLKKDPRLNELDPTLREPTSEEPGPGRDLSGQDLSGRDLRGIDLRGAKLDGAILTEARLEGALLVGASLEGAMLFKTCLREADLSKANLSLCNAASADLSGAKLEEARLEQAYFKEARLEGANLRRAHGNFVSFVGATLRGATLRGARFSQADFEQALLEDADMSEAEIVRTAFHGCRGARLNMSRSRLSHTSFMDASLEEAVFTRAWAEDSIWTRATLTRADLRLAHLRRAHFTEAEADEAKLYGADLRDCRFYRASLLRAGFARANLFGADLSKARLEGARLPAANLYDAKLLEASIQGCDFHGANLERARFEYA